MFSNNNANNSFLQRADENHVFSDVKLAKLMFVYLPEQQDQFHRPMTRISNDGSDINHFAELTNGGTNLTPEQLAGVASSFIRPSNTPNGLVKIDHGFRSHRYAFFLELVEPLFGTLADQESVEVISGYTSHPSDDAGIKRSFANPDQALIADDLMMYVNNRVTFTRQRQIGIANQMYIRPNQQQLLFHENGVDNDFTILRPCDVIEAEEKRLVEMSGNGIYRLDFRNQGAMTPLGDVKYNVPSHYLSDILTSFVKGSDPDDTQTSVYGDYDRVLSNTLSHLNDLGTVGKMANSSTYYRTICNRNPTKTSCFLFSDLTNRWDRNYVDQVTMVSFPSSRNAFIDPLSTEHWGGISPKTQIAYEMTHVVPHLLMKSLLQGLTITITDRTLDGNVHIVLTDPLEISRGFIDNQRMRWLEGQIFKDVVQSIIKPIAHENFAITMRCRLMTNHDIGISIGNHEITPYSPPSFCSSIASPQVTLNHEDLLDLRSGVIELAEMVTNVRHPFNHTMPMYPPASFGSMPIAQAPLSFGQIPTVSQPLSFENHFNHAPIKVQ